jgi:RNA polymerase sigma factor (sigma-70 family)
MTADRLAELIDAHVAGLTLLARTYCADPDDAVQAAFGKLVRQHPEPADPAAWLYRAVRNAALDVAKAARRRSRREAAAAQPEAWFAEAAIDGLDAADAVVALQALPDAERDAIVARLWGNLTLEQHAAAAGCSVSTAQRRYEAGIQRLRERFGVRWPTT